MMHVMLWKEYREHRIIWLTMLAVNSGALLALWRFAEMDSLGLGAAAVLLVWAYGMICGGMLLAGEREERTLDFLDSLPVSRLRLWLVKGQIGLLLLGGQMLVLCGWLAGLRSTEIPFLVNGTDVSPPMWPFVLGMLLAGIVGMAYALFFSARGENVLHTIGLAIFGQILAGFAAGFLALVFAEIVLISLLWLAEWLVGHDIGSPSKDAFQKVYIILAVVTNVGLTLVALVGSARRFSRPDLLRLPVSVQRMRSRASVAASLLRLVWLCYRQMHRLALGVLVFSLILGILFLLTGPLLWPVATLLLGILCGVTVFSDEQTSGSFRFLGEQRLPLFRVWLIKTSMRFALLLLASFLILVPLILVDIYLDSMSHQGEPQIIREMPYLELIARLAPLPSFLLMWLLYGFSLGLLCGLLSRKAIVAAMIALMASAMLAIVWVPSLAGIGLHFWQVAGPPLILLATTALLIWPWAADRLASRRIILGVGAASVAALLWMAFGVWYRVIEIPDVPEPFNVAAYKASLPSQDEDEARQRINHVWGRVESTMRDMNNFDMQNSRIRKNRNEPLLQQCFKVLNDGWPDGKTELGEWMDKAFAEDWLKPLAPLPELPTGMVADPRLMTLHDLDRRGSGKWRHAQGFSALLAVRGLQQQARGDPAVFVEHMRIALALSRNLQHHSPPLVTTFLGRSVARVWPTAIDVWLRKLRGRPDLLQRALQTLIDHEARLPDEREQFQADYLIARNTLMEAPEQLLDEGDPHSPYWESERRLVAMLWLFPWEQERHLRLLRVQFGGTASELRKSRDWGGMVFATLRALAREPRREPFLLELAHLRACQLALALRLYQEENGELPATLDALAPPYLKSIPLDPFSGQPFHYRRSRGEQIVWSEPGSHGQPGGLDAAPDDVPVMPRADGPAAPAVPAMGAAPRADMIEPLMEEVPIMPHAEEPAAPLPARRMLPGGFGEMMAPAEGPLPKRFVPEGQGILWSVGEDGRDDGGKKQGIFSGFTSSGEDLIYLVPPPPSGEEERRP